MQSFKNKNINFPFLTPSNKMRAFLLFALFLPCSISQAATDLIQFPFSSGKVTLKVNNKDLNVEALKRYFVIHPEAYQFEYHLPTPLTQCNDQNPNYKPCGNREINSPNFLANATINLNASNKNLTYLMSLKEYPELKPLVDYFAQSLRFGIWLEERKMAYLQSFDCKEFARNYESLPIQAATEEIVAKICKAPNKNAQWKIANHEWHNAANHLYRNREGKVPKQVWDRFLRTRHIKETIAYDDVD